MKNKVDTDFTKNRSKYVANVRYAQKDWYKEYIESGAQYRMTYLEFKRKKARRK